MYFTSSERSRCGGEVFKIYKDGTGYIRVGNKVGLYYLLKKMVQLLGFQLRRKTLPRYSTLVLWLCIPWEVKSMCWGSISDLCLWQKLWCCHTGWRCHNVLLSLSKKMGVTACMEAAILLTSKAALEVFFLLPLVNGTGVMEKSFSLTKYDWMTVARSRWVLAVCQQWHISCTWTLCTICI